MLFIVENYCYLANRILHLPQLFKPFHAPNRTTRFPDLISANCGLGIIWAGTLPGWTKLRRGSSVDQYFSYFFIRHPAKTFICRISFPVIVRFTPECLQWYIELSRDQLSLSLKGKEWELWTMYNPHHEHLHPVSLQLSFILFDHSSFSSSFQEPATFAGEFPPSVPWEDAGDNYNIAAHLGFG